jgi:hypothetical protein
MKVAFVSQPWNIVGQLSLWGPIAIWTDAVARRLVRSAEVCTYSTRARLRRRFSVAPDRWLSKWRKVVAKGKAAPHARFHVGLLLSAIHCRHIDDAEAARDSTGR